MTNKNMQLPYLDDFLLSLQANKLSQKTVYNYGRDLSVFQNFLNEINIKLEKADKKTIFICPSYAPKTYTNTESTYGLRCQQVGGNYSAYASYRISHSPVKHSSWTGSSTSSGTLEYSSQTQRVRQYPICRWSCGKLYTFKVRRIWYYRLLQ